MGAAQVFIRGRVGEVARGAVYGNGHAAIIIRRRSERKMSTALTFAGYTVKGVTLDGCQFGERALQFHDRKFWGVTGVSRIYGQYGQRTLQIPVLLYDVTDFDTARKVADYVDVTLNNTIVGQNGTLAITSESDHASFADCTFEGARILEGPKKDEGGTLGGKYFAVILLQFTQLS